MSDSENFRENSPNISYKPDLYPSGDGISWRKIPDNLFEIIPRLGARPNDLGVVLCMARITARLGHYPTFVAKRAELAKLTGLTERAITNSLRSLMSLGVISGAYKNGEAARYTWNEDLLRTLEPGSVVPVNDVQWDQCTTFSGTSERSSRIYIELSLELFYNSFREYFDELAPPFTFYVPGKRRKKDAPQGSGATIQVSRRDAWREAAHYCYGKIKNQNDALSRIYLALRASKNIEDVRFPKAALLYRVLDHSSIHEARKNSHLKEYLYDDKDFRLFLDGKNHLLGGEQHDRV